MPENQAFGHSLCLTYFWFFTTTFTTTRLSCGPKQRFEHSTDLSALAATAKSYAGSAATPWQAPVCAVCCVIAAKSGAVRAMSCKPLFYCSAVSLPFLLPCTLVAPAHGS